MMRKSKVLQKEISGNASKYDSYREAWSRIKSAQENGFFLEAIAIQESIISDRISSYLYHKTESTDCNRNSYPSLNELIKKWRSEFPDGLSSERYPDLIDAVNQWRCDRNEAIHAIVKSAPGQSTKPVDSFLQQAKEAAKAGENIARELCNWSTKKKREAETNLQS